MILVGIDPGTVTGLAVRSTVGDSGLYFVSSMPIHQAMRDIDALVHLHGTDRMLVVMEDARMNRRKRDKTSGPRQQGYGSVKRDCVIWQDYLKFLDVTVVRVPARKKVDDATFRLITGWQGRTNSHARDAAMLIHNYPAAAAEAQLKARAA